MFNTDKIQRLIFAIGFFLFAFYALRLGLAGGFLWIHIFLMSLIGGTLIFSFRDRYWLLIPISMLANITALSVFNRSINLIEVSVLVCIAVFLIHTALQKQSTYFHPNLSWPIYVHLLWVGVMFALNPIGMAFLGSENVGGRFYLNILMGALAFTVLLQQRCREKDAMFILIAGIMLSFILPIQVILRLRAIELNIFWHQSWSWPSSLLVLYLLSRYRHWNLRFLLFFLFATGIAMMSGKRATIGVILVLPLISTFFLHRQTALTLSRFAIIAIPLSVLLLTHGVMFTLPISAQRSMAFLPGRWDQSLEGMHEDLFRQEVRKLAYAEIRARPVLGRRGYALHRDELTYLLLASPTAESDMFGGHAETGNWHSTWLAFWVDFGLPAVLLYAAFSIILIRFGLRLYHQLPDRSYRKVLTGMLLLWFASHMIRSWTGGHSASIPLHRWWMLGMLVAIKQGYEWDKRKLSSSVDTQEEAQVS